MARRPFLILDISNNNRTVIFSDIREAGIVGIWHKVSEGSSFTDQFWGWRSQEIRQNEMRVGGYHFARPQIGNARLQARHFCEQLGKIERRDLAPVLDLEVNDHGLKPAQLTQWARDFNKEVQRLTGVWPLFYSYPSFIEEMRAERSIGRGLWLASYSRNDGTEHGFEVPRPFKKALAHQFSSRARVSGVHGAADLSSARRLVPILAHGWRGL